MSTRRISILTTLAALCLGMSGAALAWACTSQSHIVLGSTSVRPGGTVAVTGSAFLSGPVEIYFNGSSGRPLVTATGPSFTVNVTIPKVAPGPYYYLTAIARDATGNVVGAATKGFQVQAAPVRSRHTVGAPVSPGSPAAPHTPVSGAKRAPGTGSGSRRLHQAAPRPRTVPLGRALTGPRAGTKARRATSAAPVASLQAAPPLSAHPPAALSTHPPAALSTHPPAALSPETPSFGRGDVQPPAAPWASKPTRAADNSSNVPGAPIVIGILMMALGLGLAGGAGGAFVVARRRSPIPHDGLPATSEATVPDDSFDAELQWLLRQAELDRVAAADPVAAEERPPHREPVAPS